MSDGDRKAFDEAAKARIELDYPGYARGLEVLVRGRPVRDMGRAELIAFIGELDSFIEGIQPGMALQKDNE